RIDNRHILCRHMNIGISSAQPRALAAPLESYDWEMDSKRIERLCRVIVSGNGLRFLAIWQEYVNAFTGGKQAWIMDQRIVPTWVERDGQACRLCPLHKDRDFMQRCKFSNMQMPCILPLQGTRKGCGKRRTGAARQKCAVIADHACHRHLRPGIVGPLQKAQIDTVDLQIRLKPARQSVEAKPRNQGNRPSRMGKMRRGNEGP